MYMTTKIIPPTFITQSEEAYDKGYDPKVARGLLQFLKPYRNQMLISLVLGTLIGQSYNGTVLPLVIGFAALSASAMLVSWWAEAGARQPDPTPLTAAETPTGEIG